MQKIEIPTQCPVCESKLELVKDQLFCRNTLCEAQVGKKIEHFCKVLKIKGLGPATVSKLQLEDFTQLYFIEQDELVEAVGEKTAIKLMDEIEHSKSSDFATVLEAMSIPLVGKTASTKLATVVNNFEELSSDKCKLAGLGEKVTANLLNWFYFEYPEIKEFLPFKFESKVKQNTDGKVICITGKLESFATKKDAALALNAKGYQVTDNLTKTVDFLVDEGNKSSAKRQKAESYGITIITNLAQFINQ
jgi:DNA ligase (NAD+)